MSVVEMLVACGLFVVLTTMISAIAILSLRTATGMEARLDNSIQGNAGMAAAGKILRTAVLPDQLDNQACTNCADTAIVQASTTLITFYANLDNTGQGPSLVTLEVLQDPHTPGSGILRQTRIPPTPVAGGGYRFCTRATDATCTVDPDVRTLARGLVWPTAAVFGYYDFDGALITGTTLTTDNLPRISSIDVVVRTRTQPGRTDVPTVTTVQRVRLPNADINLLVQPT
ncbi:hypothetical protein GCM10009606_38520 [Nocardioides aquiterrae]|uniref:Type II secretion system protein n=2 Tax=Nocardioides aquiterrae TaxID=203799 RepID=A0ABP4F8U4_9ACTN